MNRFVIVLSALLIASPMLAAAQTPAPSATAKDPHVYDDAGMHFVAPDNWALAGWRKLYLKDLSDSLQLVAGWVLKSKDVPQTITLSLQLFDGDTDGYDTRFQSDLRSRVDGALVKSNVRTSLLNGMPAYFVDVSYGSGFDAKKEFALIWADGSRGAALELIGRVGEIDAKTAMKLLSNVRAVRYPADRE